MPLSGGWQPMSHSGMQVDEFAQLVRRHLPALYRLAFRFTGSQFDAEDLLQELLTRLYGRRERLTAVEILRPWLARALYNLHVDQLRSRARTPFGHLQEPANDAEESTPGQADPGASPDLSLETALLSQGLVAAVARLPEEQRLIVILHDVEGYELHEAASILGVPLGTAKSRLHRARDRLRAYLRERNFIPSNVVSGDDAAALEPANLRSTVVGDDI